MKPEPPSPSPPPAESRLSIGFRASPPEVEVGNVTTSEALPKLPQKTSLAVVIPIQTVEEFELENRQHLVKVTPKPKPSDLVGPVPAFPPWDDALSQRRFSEYYDTGIVLSPGGTILLISQEHPRYAEFIASQPDLSPAPEQFKMNSSKKARKPRKEPAPLSTRFESKKATKARKEPDPLPSRAESKKATKAGEEEPDPAPPRHRPESDTEDQIMIDDTDEDESSSDIGLDRLPTGLNLEDIQDPREREKLRNWLELGSSVATIVRSMDNNQVLRLLNSDLRKTQIANYIDWNKVLLATSGTEANFDRDDLIREGFISTFPDYPVDEANPDQAVNGYTVMKNMYLAAANDRGEVKDIYKASTQDQNRMAWHRALYHDIRSKDIVAGIKKVEQRWKEEIPRRHRSLTTIREAFDYLCNLRRPTFPWSSSEDFFITTLDMIRINEVYCMLAFDLDTERFLGHLKMAMEDAEKRSMNEWIEARTHEQYYDLLGTGLAPNFKDKIEVVPNPYSSVVE